MAADASGSYPKNGRVILHIDMNAFYCSVHEAVEPEQYKDKPTAVAGSVELRKGIMLLCGPIDRRQDRYPGQAGRQAVSGADSDPS
jgi:DNA polymerase-4